MVVSAEAKKLRNPGPSGGYQFLTVSDRLLPDAIYLPCVKLGASIAALFMPEQRKHSVDYLRLVLEREPTLGNVFNHFYELASSLVRKLRFERGVLPKMKIADCADSRAFLEFARSDRAALFGTFHVGDSDLIGCMLSDFGRQVRMVRQRVGNSHDVAMMEKAFGKWLQFIWINEPEAMLFTLKEQLQDGASLALQCDRIEFGMKQHHFRFLGKERLFPVTIYYLAHLFQMPVTFAFGVQLESGKTEVHSPGVYEPDPNAKRSDNLAAGWKHFQKTLDLLENLLRRHPYIWFNFLPLNPEFDEADS